MLGFILSGVQILQNLREVFEMKKRWMVMMGMGGIILAGGLVSAQASYDRADRRQVRQENRIDQGIASGELTAGEAARLERQQARINRVENRLEADGELSAGEKLRLEKMQDRASRNIYRKKHNAIK
jgi:hypothetical protein